MEPFFTNRIVTTFESLGFAYFHGIDERTSVFYNKDTGKFISHNDIQNFLEHGKRLSDEQLKTSIENLIYFVNCKEKLI